MLYDEKCTVPKKKKAPDAYYEHRLTCQQCTTCLKPMAKSDFSDLISYKYQQATVQSGDAVGLLAAQVTWQCRDVLPSIMCSSWPVSDDLLSWITWILKGGDSFPGSVGDFEKWLDKFGQCVNFCVNYSLSHLVSCPRACKEPKAECRGLKQIEGSDVRCGNSYTMF